MSPRVRVALTAAAAAAVAATALPAVAVAEGTAPVYMKPVGPGVALTPLVTAGDQIGASKYLFEGIPDGLGAYRNPDGTLTVLVNHELSNANSAVSKIERAWGGYGAYVDKLTFDPRTNTMTGGSELIQKVNWWDYPAANYSDAPVAPEGAETTESNGTLNHSIALNRFCSANLVAAGDLRYVTTEQKTVTKVVNGKRVPVKVNVKKYWGTTDPVFMTGEEGGDESRAFAINASTGEAYQLPRFGLGAWENLVVAPRTGWHTVALANEDGSATDSQLFLYDGRKQTAGSWADRAGLTNGSPYVAQVLLTNADGVSTKIASDNEFRAKVGKNVATEVLFNKLNWDQAGAAYQGSASRMGTTLSRIEDGAFDPKNPNDYYFVTTESNKDANATKPNPATPNISRDGGALWRLRFNDVRHPASGATLTMLLDGTEAPYLNKPDNITITSQGDLLLQEDPGANDHVSRVLTYSLKEGRIGVLAQFDPALFGPGADGAKPVMTNDEESSGVIDVTALMPGVTGSTRYFLLDAQVHTKPSIARPDIAAGLSDADKVLFDDAVIEGGQLYLMKVDNMAAVYGS